MGKPKRFAIRTVRNGRVKIHGRYYYARDFPPYEQEERPGFLPWPEELNGRRFAFGLYPDQDFVCLWGTEDFYWHGGDESVEHPDWPGPTCIDGVFHWVWWYERGIEGA